MEFKAISRCEGAQRPRVAPWSASMRTAISAWQPVRSTSRLDGLIAKLLRGRRFLRQAGRRPDAAGCRPGRRLRAAADRAGHARRDFGRKQYRKALQSTAQALAKTGARDAVVYLALEQAGDLDMEYRARIVAEVFCAQLYKIPDLKTGAKPKAPPLVERRRGGGRRARLQSGGAKACASALRSAAASRCRTRSGQSAAQCMHADLPGNPRAGLGEGISEHQDQGIGRERHQGAEDGRLPGGGARFATSLPRLIVCEYRGAQEERAADLPDRQGHHLRLGRHLPEGPARHGRNEIRHERRGGGLGHVRAIAELKLPINLVVDRRRLREHAERRRGQARRHRHDHVRPNGRDSQYRRRRTADSLRCHHLQPPLQAGRGDRRGDADRRLHHRARQPFQRPDEQ